MPSLVEYVQDMQLAISEIKNCREQIAKDPRLAAQLKAGIAKSLTRIEEKSSALYQGLGEMNVNLKIPTVTLDKKTVAPKTIPKPGFKSTFVPKPLVRQIPLPQTSQNLAPVKEQSMILSPDLASKKFQRLSPKDKERYIKELKISYEELEDFVKAQRAKRKGKLREVKTADFTLYQPNQIGAVANRFMKGKADRLIKKYPNLFKPLFDVFLKVDMSILSRSYVATILFFSALAFPVALAFFSLMNIAFGLSFIIVLAVSFFVALITPVAFYFYPQSLIGDRRKLIKRDLPFALVHMSAVAGSGAAPISIFELLVESDEYPELKKEIKKILNYVNLFGYNLSNALRNLAATTPSEELKELLNGMISTVETGGDLKGYLKEKSDDALNTYRLERKQQVEALGTFSEVYTSILIAAPLLLIITLAIINSIGGGIGGISVKLLAYLGVGVALPLLNIGFMFFLNSQSSNY